MRTALVSFFIVLLCLGSRGLAQSLPADLKFTNYTRADGLPEEQITSIIQDSRGFLWIGSVEGLFRFDGLHFKSWYADLYDSTRFSNNNIYVVAEYKPGKILFKSQFSLWEISIDNHQMRIVPGFRDKKVTGLPIRLSEGQWAVTTEDSLHILSSSFETDYALALQPVFNSSSLQYFHLQYPYLFLFETAQNRYWIFNYEQKKLFPVNISDPGLDPRAKFLTPQAYDSVSKRLYLSAYFDGVYSLDLPLHHLSSKNEPVSPVLLLKDGAIKEAKLLSGNRFLLAGHNGFYLTDFQNTQRYHSKLDTDRPLVAEPVLTICQDHSNNFWLGTTGGLSRFSLKPPVIRYWRKELGFETDDEFKAIVKGDHNIIYLLTQTQSLFELNTLTNHARRLDSKLSYSWSAIREGDLITATGAGPKLIQFNIKTGAVSTPDFLQPFYSPITDLVTLAFKARNGDTWYSCNGRGGLIRKRNSTQQYTPYTNHSNPPFFPHSYLHCAAEDSKGNIWFGTTRSDLLLKWELATEQFRVLRTDSLVPGLRINSGINLLHVDAKDQLWIGFDNAALLRYDLRNKTAEYYDINRGLPTEKVNSICHDDKNRIWVGTLKGVSCYLPETNRFTSFTSLDGFPEDELPGTAIFFDAEENKIYVAGKRSVAAFNPDSLLNNIITVKPPVFIDEITVNGKPLYFEGSRITKLNWTENNIEFGFSAPDFNRNNQLIFQYRLEGASPEWVDLGDKRSVTFNNLASGRYTLSVRCKYKGNDSWNETSVPFTFIVKTPWFRSNWFWVIASALLGISVWLIIRSYYRRKLEKQKMLIEKELAIEQERTRMARELHDGLGSMLSGIKHSFSAMEKQIPLSESQQLKFHSNIDKLNDSILQLRNITHSMATESALQYGLENALRDYCRNISGNAGLLVSFSAVGTTEMKLTEEQSFHSFRIIQELLQNIIKHAEASQAIVQISYHDHHFHIAVEDDGKGFSPAAVQDSGGMGLKNIESRVQILKGQMDYQTTPGKGTSVLIDINCS